MNYGKTSQGDMDLCRNNIHNLKRLPIKDNPPSCGNVRTCEEVAGQRQTNTCSIYSFLLKKREWHESLSDCFTISTTDLLGNLSMLIINNY